MDVVGLSFVIWFWGWLDAEERFGRGRGRGRWLGGGIELV
jgi:hypothetical protein